MGAEAAEAVEVAEAAAAGGAEAEEAVAAVGAEAVEAAAAVGAEAAADVGAEAADAAAAVGAAGAEADEAVVVGAEAGACSRPKERHNGHGEVGGRPVGSSTPYVSSCIGFQVTLRGIAKRD